jgi:hypothetical protein
MADPPTTTPRDMRWCGQLCPTAFPTPPNFGASFNKSLAVAMGKSFGYELRAFYNAKVQCSDLART